MTDIQERMPALYLSHGAPPLADDALWPDQLRAWSAGLPRPKAILMVSAHWEEAPLALGATETLPLVYDFWGFPEHYYQVTYAAPGAPQLADSVRKLLRGAGTPVQDIPDRGLDHGAYVPLVEMYPGADIPVLQISLPTLDPRGLMDIGRKLAPLRDEGVLIIPLGLAAWGDPQAASSRTIWPRCGNRTAECPRGPWSSTPGAMRRSTRAMWTASSTSGTSPRRASSHIRARSTSRPCS